MPEEHKRHPLFARYYVRASRAMETGGMAGHRREALAGLAGAVIEAGAGNGLNFGHYPVTVTRVLAVEPDPHLRGIAAQAAARAPVPVEVRAGVAERLPATDGEFDAAVVGFVLCSVASQQVALAELRRVIRPGGQLRFMEHVRAGTPALRRVQRAVDATIWPLLAGGCHTARDTVSAIAGSGFTIERVTEFRFPDARWSTPATPHVSGVAIRDP